MSFPRWLIPGSLLAAALLSLVAMAFSEGDVSEATLFYSKPEYRPFLEEWKKEGQVPGAFALINMSDSRSLWSESMSIGQMIELRADPQEWTKAQIRDLSQFILLKSEQFDISPLLVLSLIEVESRFRVSAVSKKGAMGLMQVMPATAAFLSITDSDLQWGGTPDLNNPKVNIEYGLRYMTRLKTQFQKPEHVITAYNIGPTALSKKLRNGEVVSLDYYKKVMEAMRTYKRGSRDARNQPSRRKATWL
ncbi:MAG: lytic transglycosylase domain-containing protein [Bdellovibrionota bacterium]